MQAFGFNSSHSSPLLFEQTTPQAGDRDLLIAIDAIAVNPIDIKVKSKISGTLSSPKILGWDAAGTVVGTGDEVSLFKLGDKVYYAGDITRAGSYASHQLVDERIVGHAPKSLSSAETAVMPLTSITAWESLLSRLKINPEQDAGKNILIIGGAGGVGSIGIQLAKVVAKLNVIATASRNDTEKWCYELGADQVINHRAAMVEQYRALGIGDPDYILCLSYTDLHFSSMVELIAPQGLICTLVDTQEKQDLNSLKMKSAGWVWESMFARSMFKTPDMIEQHLLLNQVAALLDEGKIISSLRKTLGPMTADNIAQAHQQLETGTTIGKIALTGIESGNN